METLNLRSVPRIVHRNLFTGQKIQWACPQKQNNVSAQT